MDHQGSSCYFLAGDATPLLGFSLDYYMAVILLTHMDTYELNTFLCSVLGKIKAPERGLHFLQRNKMHRHKINYRKKVHNNMLPAIHLITPGMPGQMVIDTGVELARKGFCRN